MCRTLIGICCLTSTHILAELQALLLHTFEVYAGFGLHLEHHGIPETNWLGKLVCYLRIQILLGTVWVVAVGLQIFEDLVSVLGSIDIVLLSIARVKNLSYIFKWVVDSLDFTLQLEVHLRLRNLTTNHRWAGTDFTRCSNMLLCCVMGIIEVHRRFTANSDGRLTLSYLAGNLS